MYGKNMKIYKFYKNFGLWYNHVQQTLLCLGFLRFKEVDFLFFWFKWLHEWLETISIDSKVVLAIGIQ